MSAPDWARARSRIYWYDQYANNEQATAFARYDPERITAELLGTGADMVVLYASNQFGIAYYPSAVWPQHPGLGGRDYVGELSERLRRAGKRIVLYVNWLDSKHAEWGTVPLGRSRTDAGIREERLASWADPTHPHGRVQDLPGGGWRCPCFNSPQGAQVAEVARELCGRYRPDGLSLDMLVFQQVCACEHCLPELRRICGTEEVTRQALEAHWQQYVAWKCERVAAVLARVSDVLRAHGVLAVHNAFAPLYLPADSGVSEAWLPALDVWVSECWSAFLSPYADLNAASVTLRWQRAVGLPAWLLRTSTPVAHHAHQPISRALWRLEAAACKANGGQVFGPCGVGARPDTTSSPELLRGVREAFDFYMEDADLAEGAESAAEVALVFSWATRRAAGPGADAMRWAEEFHGWARLLIEEHVPFDVAVAEATADLARYRLVILPDTAALQDPFCDALRRYVAAGGALLATGRSSLLHPDGTPRADLALGDVLGVRRLGEREHHFAVARAGREEPEPFTGLLQEIRAVAAETLARYVPVDPAGSVLGGEDPLPLEPADRPVATRAGRAAYVAFGLGQLYERHGDPHVGAWMAELIDELHGTRALRVRAPRTVEVTLWRQPAVRRTVVHLVNRTVPWSLPTDRRQVQEVVPVPDVEVALAAPSPYARCSARHAAAVVRRDGDRLCARLRVLDAYAALVFEGV